MKTISLRLKNLHRYHPQAAQTLQLTGTLKGNILTVPRDAWQKAIAAEPPQPKHLDKLKPIPRERWPAWATSLAVGHLPEETGLGDTLARVIGPFDSDAFKTWYAEVRGVMKKTCHCAHWHAQWNKRFPYLPA